MPHDLNTWISIGQFGATCLLIPAIKVLRDIEKSLADYKVHVAENYATKKDLENHKCGQ